MVTPPEAQDQLHVVFGAGHVGQALAACLAGRGLAVRAVSRHRPPGLADGVDWRAADASDAGAASDAAKGAAVVYQCLNAPYAQWPELFPPLQRGVLAAAERAGALLLPHTYSYIPDIAAGLATLGTDPRAAGEVWHLPGPQTVTTRALLDLVAGEVGHPVAVRSVPKLAVRALGLVNPTMRALAEMAYEFDEPFILDTARYQAAFGPAGTPLAAAVAATLAWYRTQTS